MIPWNPENIPSKLDLKPSMMLVEVCQNCGVSLMREAASPMGREIVFQDHTGDVFYRSTDIVDYDWEGYEEVKKNLLANKPCTYCGMPEMVVWQFADRDELMVYYNEQRKSKH